MKNELTQIQKIISKIPITNPEYELKNLLEKPKTELIKTFKENKVNLRYIVDPKLQKIVITILWAYLVKLIIANKINEEKIYKDFFIMIF